MRFTSRESEIIICLQEQEISINQLATEFNVSTKTIKSDLKRINDKIISYDSKILADGPVVRFKSIYPSVHWKNIVRLNRTIEEEDLIFLKLLFKSEFISISDFADELYISKSKLEKLLLVSPNLNQHITKKRNLGIKIELVEADKISLAISILLPYVDDLNYLVTARALVQQINERDVTIEQFNIYIKLFNSQVSSLERITDQECKILILLILITKHLLNYEDLIVNQMIIEYINKEQGNEKVKTVIEQDIREILKSNNIAGIGDELLRGLISHIENVVSNQYANTIEEAMELRLKTEYSYAYAIATELYNKLTLSLGVNIEEYEKNYLTLYIQSLINNSSEFQNMNILIVCQYGLSVSNYIQTWIEQNIRIPLNFKISSVLNYWNLKDTTNQFDLIITTIDNLEAERTKIVKVDTVPLEQQLATVKQNILNVHFQKQMNSFFSGNSLRQISIKSIEEMYPLISNDFNNCNTKFIEAMKKRTDEGLSNVNGVIIMHSDGSLITEDKLLIYKLKEPINYNQEQVKMIFVFAFSLEFIERFNSVIKQIYRIIYSEQYVSALYETTTDKQFMWILRNQIKDKPST